MPAHTEMAHHKQHRHCHGYIGGDGRALDAKAKRPHKQRRQQYVKAAPHKHCGHGLHRIARGSHHVVERECEVRHQQTGKDILHEIAGIGQRGVVGAEQSQYRRQEQGKQGYINCADYQGERERVAEHTTGAAGIPGT